MSNLVCEICGSNSFFKANGQYICNRCGKKYSDSEAKALMMRVSVKKPTVAISSEESKKTKLAVAPVIPLKKKPEKETKPNIRLKDNKPEPKRVEVKKLNRVASTTVEAKPDASIKHEGLSLGKRELINSFTILMMDSFNNKNYLNAEVYADKIIQEDYKNTEAWYIKGCSEAYRNSSVTFRLNDSINSFSNASLSASSDAKGIIEYLAANIIIEAARNLIISELAKKDKIPTDEHLRCLDDSVNYLAKSINSAHRLINLNETMYYDYLSLSINEYLDNLLDSLIKDYNSNNINDKANLFYKYKDSLDVIIKLYDYIIKFSHRGKALSNTINGIIKAYHEIINNAPKDIKDGLIKAYSSRLNTYLKDIEAKELSNIRLNPYVNPNTEINEIKKEAMDLENKKKRLPELIEAEALEVETNRIMRLNSNNPRISSNKNRIIKLRRAALDKELALIDRRDDLEKEILLIQIKHQMIAI